MSHELVRVDWIRDQVFLLQDRFGFPVVMTQPQGVNGADLLPLSLVGCALWDIVNILHKQRQHITRAYAWAESARETEHPWRFLSIKIHYRFAGVNLKPNQIHRAIVLSENGYCSIFATLRRAVELSSDFEIVDNTEA